MFKLYEKRWKHIHGEKPDRRNLTDTNISRFISHLWEEDVDGNPITNKSRASVQQGKSYVNSWLRKHGLPRFLDQNSNDEYKEAWKTFAGIRNTAEWRDYVAQGGQSLEVDELKKCLLHPVRNTCGDICKRRLRDKVIMLSFLHWGAHASDVARMK